MTLTALHRPLLAHPARRPAWLFVLVALAGPAACAAGHSTAADSAALTGSPMPSNPQGNTPGISPVASGDSMGVTSPETTARHGQLTLKQAANKCLGLAPDGRALGLFDCAGLGTQGWDIEDRALVHSSGLCLEAAGNPANGSGVKLAQCVVGQASQAFVLGTKGLTLGTGDLCLDSRDHKQNEGNPIQLWACNQTENQLWRMQDPSAAAKQTLGAWITTPDLTRALSAAAIDTEDNAVTAPHDVTVTLDPGVTYQTITGFGASLVDSSTAIMHTGLTQEGLDAAMGRLFDPATGIGISLLRQPMGASDFSSVGNFSYADTNQDFNLDKFSIAQDLKHTVPLLKMAVKANPKIFIMATPWSPPAWMKNNSSMFGAPAVGGSSTLKDNARAAYAQYFVKFLQAYEAQGIRVQAITPQNEPLNDANWPSLVLPADKAADFVGNYLGPALKAAQQQTAIWAYDHNWDDIGYPQTVLNHATAKAYVNAAAFHCYGGEVSAMSAFHSQAPAVPIHMTECSNGAWRSDPFGEMSQVLLGSVNNWSSSVVFWVLALDPQLGPQNNGCNNCAALITVDPASKSISYNMDYYIIGHASKYVLPGAKRIGHTQEGGNVMAATFKNTDGSLVALLLNTSTQPQRTLVKGGNHAVMVSLPSRALATVRLADTQAP